MAKSGTVKLREMQITLVILDFPYSRVFCIDNINLSYLLQNWNGMNQT